MKKLISLILLFSLLGTLFACTPTEEPDNTTVRLAGMTGPTSMGLVKLAEDNAAGTTENTYDIKTTYTKADEILPKLLQGELDMAALPANVAATLYKNSNEQITVLAINTLGVVNIVEKGESITSLADLAGKTIYAVGKGTTPEMGLRYLLAQNGVDFDSLTVEWKNSPNEILPLLKTAENAIAMIPQPVATAATKQVEGLRIALDLNDEWNKLDNGSQFVTGVLVARRAFVNEHPTVVAKFLEEYETSVNFAKTNVKETAPLITKYGIMDAKTNLAVIEAALPKCNLTFIAGDEMKTVLSGYLQTLFDQNPAAVGGEMPSDGFYYIAK